MRRIATLLFCLLFAPISFAQNTNASVTGFIQDSTKAFIPGVTVTAISVGTDAKFTTKTDKSGSYEFPSLPDGPYRMEIEKPGFKTILKEDLDLHVQSALEVNFQMAVGSASESITITGNSAEINTTNGTVSTVIDKTLIENMPLNGKDLTTLFELSPGTVMNAGGSAAGGGGFSVNGQRPTSNYLTIDGASGNAYTTLGNSGGNVTGASIATSASGGTSGILPIDAIEEYRMDTSTYTAENGRTPGGQIQVRTRSGTNEFHGTLFENFRNQVLDATDWFVKYNHLLQSQLRMNDFGGTLGGPLLRNKLFFFAAHDTLILNQPNTTSQSVVPSQALIATAYPAYKTFMAAFPTGNGGANPTLPGFEFYNISLPYIIRNHTTSIRLDAQLPRSIHAFFRANIAPTFSSSTGVDSVQAQDTIYSYTAGLTAPLGKHLVEELTVNRTANQTDRFNFVGASGGNNPTALQNNLPTGVGNNDLFSFYLAVGGTYPYISSGPLTQYALTQWNILDSVTWQAGTHTLKAGADILARQSRIVRSGNSYTIYTAEDPSPYPSLQNGVVNEFDTQRQLGQPIYSVNNTSLYINDDWHIRSGLLLNFGVRWEYNPAPSVGPLGVMALQGTSLNPATITAAVSNQSLYANV